MFDKKKSDRPLKIWCHFKFLKISDAYFKHVLPSENYEKYTEGTSIAEIEYSQIFKKSVQ